MFTLNRLSRKNMLKIFGTKWPDDLINPGDEDVTLTGPAIQASLMFNYKEQAGTAMGEIIAALNTLDQSKNYIVYDVDTEGDFHLFVFVISETDNA